MKASLQINSLCKPNWLILFTIIVVQRKCSEPFITLNVNEIDDFRTEKAALTRLIKANTE